MAEKAGDLIKDALGEIVVLGAEASLEADDAQLSLRYLNRMMAALSVKGIDIGYTELDSLGDSLTTPAGATEGMISLLAVRLWKPFSEGQPIPQALLATAADGLKTLLSIAIRRVGQTEYPDTLPIGSGNQVSGQLRYHFYPDLEAEILAELTGSIGLEDRTVTNE